MYFFPKKRKHSEKFWKQQKKTPCYSISKVSFGIKQTYSQVFRTRLYEMVGEDEMTFHAPST